VLITQALKPFGILISLANFNHAQTVSHEIQKGKFDKHISTQQQNPIRRRTSTKLEKLIFL
jgi:hypothetical protein